MTTDRRITFFHAPNSRSAGARILLEELGADYELHPLDLKRKQQREPAYLAVNPMGKVPAIRHGGELVTEQSAVYMYLAELYPEAGLSPAVGDPQRGTYLRWMAFYGSCFEPAVVDRSMPQREAASPSICPYGDYDTMLATVMAQLAQGPYLLGERVSAADVLWGAALGWIVAFGLVPDGPLVRAYIERMGQRPAALRAAQLDAELAAALDAAAA